MDEGVAAGINDAICGRRRGQIEVAAHGDASRGKVCRRSRQRGGVHVGQTPGVTAESAEQRQPAGIIGHHRGGELGQGHRAAQLRAGHIAQQIAGAVGHDGIGRGQNRLARGQGDERGRAVRARRDLQPARRPGEHAVAEVQRHREQAVGDARGGIGQRPGDEAAIGHRVANREAQIVKAGGGVGAVIQLALIAEGRALGGRKLQAEQHEGQPGEYFVFHRLFEVVNVLSVSKIKSSSAAW